jgi:hypothetical protein
MLSNSGHFKAYDMAKEYVSEEHRASVNQTLGHDSAKTYPEPIYTKGIREFRDPFYSKVRASGGPLRVASFDFLNMTTSNEPSAITLLANGNVAIFALQSPPRPMDLSSQGVLGHGGLAQGDSNFKVIAPLSDPGTKISHVVQTIQDRILSEAPPLGASHHEPNSHGNINEQPVESKKDIVSGLSSRESREKHLSMGTLGTPLTIQDALTWMTIPRLRCKEGYLFDSERNKEILSDDFGLQELWHWIGRTLCGCQFSHN